MGVMLQIFDRTNVLVYFVMGCPRSPIPQGQLIIQRLEDRVPKAFPRPHFPVDGVTRTSRDSGVSEVNKKAFKQQFRVTRGGSC